MHVYNEVMPVSEDMYPGFAKGQTLNVTFGPAGILAERLTVIAKWIDGKKHFVRFRVEQHRRVD